MGNCTNNIELISAFIDDELKGKEVEDLLLHIEQCSDCKSELSKLLTIKEIVKKEFELIPGILPPQNFASQVMKEIEKRDKTYVRKFSLADFFMNFFAGQLKTIAYVCTVILIIVFGVWFFKQKGKHSDNFLNIYELKSVKKTSPYTSYAWKGRKVNDVLFYHLRQTNTLAFESNPVTVEYAAYTTEFIEK